jgi:hypothetical protein
MPRKPHIDRSARGSRLVAGAAVTAVCITSLGAAWLSRGEASALHALRPAADAPVRVVRAPVPHPALQAPTAAADGSAARAGGWL